MVLAAGRGVRLRPYTDRVPKCMTLVEGRPVLEHVIRHLAQHGVDDIVVNLHHLPEPVVHHFGDGAKLGVHLTWSYETTLLGTAGGVARMSGHFGDRFLVWYGDNLSNLRLDRLVDLHAQREAVATIALHHRDDVTQCGIVDINEASDISRFLEKPRNDQVFSHWVNAGVYVLERQVLDVVPDGVEADFGRDVFPRLIEEGGRVCGYRMRRGEHLRWFDTPSDLARLTSPRPTTEERQT